MPSASMFRRALSSCCRICNRPTMASPVRREPRAHYSMLCLNLRTMRFSRSFAIAISSRPSPAKPSRASRPHGVTPETTARCVTAHFVSARGASGTSLSHSHRTEDARLIVEPTMPPRHALLAFGLWLRHVAKVDALVHMGAHGTLEWLPGKAVALTASCFPELMVGCLPVIYPFIVSNPGEAAQAKRRIAAVTIGHLPPPLVEAGLAGAARELERLIDEYAQADGLDRRRRERLARLILEQAERTGLAVEARVQ